MRTGATARAEMRDLLVGVARRRALIPYSALAAQIKTIRFAADDPPFHRMLDEVSTAEDEEGRGLLTVIVVHKDGDNHPGPGFFELAASRGRDVRDILRTWAEELETVHLYWSKHSS